MNATLLRRLALGLVALGCLAWAGTLVAEWTDRGDATCTALYRVDRTSYWFVGDCADVMGKRLALVIVLLIVAVALLVLGVRRPSSTKNDQPVADLG